MYSLVKSILRQKGTDIQSVAPETPVTQAVRIMDAKRIGGLLVMKDGRTVGIFTERDLMRRVVAAGLDPLTTPVSEVMTREVIAIKADTSVDDAMAVISQKRCRHLPVVDGEQLVGMISSGDLTHWQSQDRELHIEELVNFITGKYPA